MPWFTITMLNLSYSDTSTRLMSVEESSTGTAATVVTHPDSTALNSDPAPASHLCTVEKATYNSNLTTSHSVQISIQQYPEYLVAIYSLKYILPLIVLSGVTGNIISFLVLIRRRIRHTVVYIYLALLALADNGVLLISALKTWIRVLSGFEFLHVSDFCCKTITFLFLISMHMSAWLLVAMTIDRLIAVVFPLKASAWCTTTRALKTSVTLLVVCILLNAHIFGTYGLRTIGKQQKCTYAKQNFFMSKIFPWLKLSSYSILPFAFILIINLAIVQKILQSRRERHATLVQNQVHQAMSRVNQNRNRVTIVLLSITCAWLLLTAPSMLWTFLAHKDTADPHTKAKNLLAKTICFLLMYTNHGINFVLYCLSSRNFRKEVHRMFCVSFYGCKCRSSTRLLVLNRVN